MLVVSTGTGVDDDAFARRSLLDVAAQGAVGGANHKTLPSLFQGHCIFAHLKNLQTPITVARTQSFWGATINHQQSFAAQLPSQTDGWG
jgi:hypothetical protein